MTLEHQSSVARSRSLVVDISSDCVTHLGSMEIVPKQVYRNQDELNQALGKVEILVNQLTSQSRKEVSESVSTLDNAKLNAGLAYTLNTLFFSNIFLLFKVVCSDYKNDLVYLKCKGETAQTHPVRKELERVQQYMQKIKLAGMTETESKPKLRVDSDAAQRMITHQLSSANPPSYSGKASRKRKPSSESVSARVTKSRNEH